MPTPSTPKTYTVDELLAMSDERFEDAMAGDLRYAAQYKGPFQHESVVERTLHALLLKLWFADSRIQLQAEDPEITPERYAKTVAFRNHLVGVVDVTERRVDRVRPRAVREASAWKQLLHDVLDEIKDGPDDDILDDFDIPFAENLNLRTWLEIRCIKDPSRIKKKEAVGA